MTKEIEQFINTAKSDIIYYLDMDLYIPMKEELVGVTHSLGIRKELFKQYVESELEKLKNDIKEYVDDNFERKSDIVRVQDEIKNDQE